MLFRSQYAYSRGDTSAVRQLLEHLASAHAAFRPGDLTLDAIVPESWLLAAMGDFPAAIRRLDPTVNATRYFDPNNLDDFTRAALMVRSMRLRADLAQCTGDAAARLRWQSVADALWIPSSEASRVSGAPRRTRGPRQEGSISKACIS